MTEQAIEAVTMQDAAKALRDKIRLGFAELIPPEQWEAMIKQELASFFADRQERDHWGSPRGGTKASLFREACEEVFREHVKAKLKAELEGWEGFVNHADGHLVHTPGEAVKQWLKENTAQLVHVFVAELMGSAVQRTLTAARQGM